MINFLLSAGIFLVLLILNKKLRSIKFFAITVVIYLLLATLILVFSSIDYRLFILSAAYLTIYQPIRLAFKQIKKRDPILYIRGVHLTPQEQVDISVDDYLFSAAIIIIPVLSLIPFYL